MVFPRNDAPRRPGRGFQSIDNTRRMPNNARFSRGRMQAARIDFETLNKLVLPHLPELLARWLPDGKPRGREFLARNPRRNDETPGSFSINMSSGSWADFADHQARGRDCISLAAYIHNLPMGKAARLLSDAVGVEVPHV